MMQFVLMIYQGTTPVPADGAAWAALSEAEQRSIYADYAKLNALAEVTAGPPLGLPEAATTVRVADGRVTTAEGPVAGVEHAVGGIVVVEADDLDAAVALAAQIPPARLGGAVEVRPCATYW
jgi:hypothetical protein